MTTLSQLADRIQYQLNDIKELVWPQIVIEKLLIEGIHDYSTYFRRHAQLLIWQDLVPGQQAFPLPDDFREMLSVEYPINSDPPRYLLRRPRTHPRFWTEPGYYDYHRQPDARAPDPANILYISDPDLDPDANHMLLVTYTAAHVTDLDPTDTLSIPAEHEHILALFVIWKAYNERLATYMATPISEADVTIMQQMKLAAESAERAYRAAITAAANRAGAGGTTGPWTIDHHDPIY